MPASLATGLLLAGFHTWNVQPCASWRTSPVVVSVGVAGGQGDGARRSRSSPPQGRPAPPCTPHGCNASRRRLGPGGAPPSRSRRGLCRGRPRRCRATELKAGDGATATLLSFAILQIGQDGLAVMGEVPVGQGLQTLQVLDVIQLPRFDLRVETHVPVSEQ